MLTPAIKQLKALKEAAAKNLLKGTLRGGLSHLDFANYPLDKLFGIFDSADKRVSRHKDVLSVITVVDKRRFLDFGHIFLHDVLVLAMDEIAEHLDFAGKPINVYYLGDFDPSGCSAEIELQARVKSQFRKTSTKYLFDMSRLAIHGEDIKRFRLPPLKVKSTDSRAGGFLVKHGKQCVELDALPPTELRRRIRRAVMKHVDKESWERSKMVEGAESRSIVDFAKRLQNLSVEA